MRHGKRPAHRSNGGFTLFEMVVSICTIVILYQIAEQRLNQLPAAAERASFFAVLEQIKTGVNFEMVTKLAASRREEIVQMEGSNPMRYLIEVPSNYRGELERVTDAIDRRSSWYFETSSGELVYVVGGSSIGDVAMAAGQQTAYFGQIRLKITNEYSGADGHRRWEGLRLKPVGEFIWERRTRDDLLASAGVLP